MFHGLYVGLGTGLRRYHSEGVGQMADLVQTYFHLRYSFQNKSVSPFVDLKGGLLSDLTKHFTGVGTDTEGVGCFFGPAVGVEYRRFGLKVGYYRKGIWTYGKGEGVCSIGVFYKF